MIQIDTNLAPTQKVTAAALGGACATILCWGLGTWAGVHFPPGIESAIAVVCSVLVAYFKVEPQ